MSRAGHLFPTSFEEHAGQRANPSWQSSFMSVSVEYPVEQSMKWTLTSAVALCMAVSADRPKILWVFLANPRIRQMMHLQRHLSSAVSASSRSLGQRFLATPLPTGRA